jgi:general L-amino acid transport system permease protein
VNTAPRAARGARSILEQLWWQPRARAWLWQVLAGGFCWSFLQDRWRQILFGTFPYDEQWRAGLACALFLGLIVITFAVLGAPTTRRLRRLALAWLASLAAITALMAGGVLGLVAVPSRLWAGLPLTLMLAAVGTALGFVLGVLLALARREARRGSAGWPSSTSSSCGACR